MGFVSPCPGNLSRCLPSPPCLPANFDFSCKSFLPGPSKRSGNAGALGRGDLNTQRRASPGRQPEASYAMAPSCLGAPRGRLWMLSPSFSPFLMKRCPASSSANGEALLLRRSRRQRDLEDGLLQGEAGARIFKACSERQTPLLPQMYSEQRQTLPTAVQGCLSFHL